MTDIHATNRFQILALDGGGLKGLFAAAVLAALEKDLGHPLSDHFDLIAGTSTGGIIALGLGAGLTPREIVEFYIDKGPVIFPDALHRLRSVRHLARSKYGSGDLRAAVQEIFGDALLGDSTKRLVVPAYNLDADEVYIFKTAHHEKLRRDYRVPLWEVAMATSAAPTYLPAFSLLEGRVRLVDGGVWANNPVVVAIAEAVSMLGVPLERIRVLSIGTSSETVQRKLWLNNGGLIQWARGNTVVDVLLRGQSVGANGLAQHLVGRGSVVRIDPTVPPKALRLDSVDADQMVSMAASHSRNGSPQFFESFTEHTAPVFKPFYQVGSAPFATTPLPVQGGPVGVESHMDRPPTREAT